MNDLAAEQPEKAKQLAGRWQEILDGFAKDLAASGEKKGEKKGKAKRKGR